MPPHALSLLIQDSQRRTHDFGEGGGVARQLLHQEEQAVPFRPNGVPLHNVPGAHKAPR